MPKLGWTPEKSQASYTLYNEDCREVMQRMPPKSVDSMAVRTTQSTDIFK